MRHPEPKMVDEWKVTEPELQIRGAWTKLNSGKGTGPEARMGFAGWIWNSKMYIGLGHAQEPIRFFRDLWYACVPFPVIVSCLDFEPGSSMSRNATAGSNFQSFRVTLPSVPL